MGMRAAILSFTIFLMGVAFAPIWTPHVVERYGRSAVYLSCHFIFMIFLVGASQSRNIGTLLVTRFFAGFFGGPELVLIEGTFADVWSASTTNTYYAFLGISSYIGAALGPLVCGFVIKAEGWRWAPYVSLMIAFGAWLLAFGVPETYQREIPRRHARRTEKKHTEAPAESGETFAQIIRIAVVEPIVMAVSEPIVMMSTIYLMLNWGILFQFFVTVPVVLNAVYDFPRTSAGLAFSSAIAGTVAAAITVVVIEQVLHFREKGRNGRNASMPIEYRLIPAMIGAPILPASLFWIGWTAKPTVHFITPVVGTAAYVYASLLILISIVTYLFDAYPAAGTLSALTIAAVARILTAAIVPIFALDLFAKVTGAWALSIFGFIGIGLLWIPFALFFFGRRLRERSRFTSRMSIHDN